MNDSNCSKEASIIISVAGRNERCKSAYAPVLIILTIILLTLWTPSVDCDAMETTFKAYNTTMKVDGSLYSVTITYPGTKSGAPFPVIIFAHGLCAEKGWYNWLSPTSLNVTCILQVHCFQSDSSQYL